jgi:hypothetical protein
MVDVRSRLQLVPAQIEQAQNRQDKRELHGRGPALVASRPTERKREAPKAMELLAGHQDADA